MPRLQAVHQHCHHHCACMCPNHELDRLPGLVRPLSYLDTWLYCNVLCHTFAVKETHGTRGNLWFALWLLRRYHRDKRQQIWLHSWTNRWFWGLAVSRPLYAMIADGHGSGAWLALLP
jgi:hypothetical protein